MLERNTENEIGAVRHPEREVVGIRAIYVIEGLTDRNAQIEAVKRQGIAVANIHEHPIEDECNARCVTEAKL